MITPARLKEIQSWPECSRYKYYPDEMKILVCQIKIWNLKDKSKPLDPPPSNCLILNEVESIEINNTFKQLIDKATVKFPRGTMIQQTITDTNLLESDNKESVIASITQTNGDMGVLVEKRKTNQVASTTDFEVGRRICIKIGYASNPEEAKLVNDESKNTFLHKMFDGYIVKCSVSTPIEIKCENLASGLKKKSCRNLKSKGSCTVNDFLKVGGKYYMLKGTGLSIHPDTEKCDINIGHVALSDDLTVADVLTEWSKYKLFAFLKEDNGIPKIAVGRSYFSTKSKESILSGMPKNIPVIQFDYHVSDDNLTLLHTKKSFLAVEAQMSDVKGNFYKITIRQNPDYDINAKSGPTSKKYDLLKETNLSKKAQKLGAVKLSGSTNKVDLSDYNLVQYMSKRLVPKIDDKTQSNLIKEAIKFFEGYAMNGIEGNISIFGDLHIKSGTKIQFIDIRHKGKNGYYVAEEVNTTFGVSGYRQSITVPYRLSKADHPEDPTDNLNKISK